MFCQSIDYCILGLPFCENRPFGWDEENREKDFFALSESFAWTVCCHVDVLCSVVRFEGTTQSYDTAIDFDPLTSVFGPEVPYVAEFVDHFLWATCKRNKYSTKKKPDEFLSKGGT